MPEILLVPLRQLALRLISQPPPGDLDRHCSDVVVLTHDPKIDDPALKLALRSPAFYVGALGSRTTHAKRIERLRQDGLSNEVLARLRTPVGLDLGARTPQEIALSVLAEITASRHGMLAMTS